ncbi:iron uptake porin [Alkalinema sp. FACHB-956]|uniref:iron uptake porin n=1 Tax=Alkalinema sp. FACHB-956 TaxID=2692768 RepID=UPI001F551074|nr:iron uptake porin [Alkalinema sp. FACHB-956]
MISPRVALSNEPSVMVDEMPLAQITSVSQLSDVKPTDWAFQALQSLVERYGCIAGYPDRTFRGNRALTRYEFAAGLNACMDRINELITAATDTLANKADLATLEQLQTEFAAELATLRGRVDALESKVATLQKQQFSTTTKLTGDLWFNWTSAFPTGDVLAERGVPGSAFAPPRRSPITNQPSRVVRQGSDTAATFGYYLFLNLNTSFTGKDLLVTQLVTGNGSSPANQLVSAGFFNSWGVPFLDQTGSPTANSVVVRELSYTFPLSKDIRLAVGPRLNFYKYYDGNRYTFFMRGATSYNSNGSTLSNAVDRGSGAVLTWTISPQLRLTTGFLAENTEFLNPATFNTSSNPNAGLFNSTYTIASELAYSPIRNLNLKLHYARTRIKAYNGFIGGAVGEPLPYGYADDGFGGRVNDANSDTWIVNLEWNITKKFGLFGRYSWGRVGIDPINPARAGGDIKVQSFQVGMGFPDLGKLGALGVISFVMPHSYTSGRNFLLSGAGDGGKQYDLEFSYYYPINKNLAIVPAFYAIFNPNNFESNSTVYVGNIRTQFSF